MPGKPAAKPEKPKPAFGRKQFDNTRNTSAGAGARAGLGSYTQAHGTISAAGLAALRQTKWWHLELNQHGCYIVYMVETFIEDWHIDDWLIIFHTKAELRM